MRLSFKKQAILSLTSLHCVHWQHGPRHLAQQGHLRARSCGFFLQRRSTSKGTWGMVLLIVCCAALLFLAHRRSHFALCTSTMLWSRNVTLPLISNGRLHGYMEKHNADFTGEDFNMSAFSTVGDVLSDLEFSAPGNSFLWGLGALEEPNRECTGFSNHAKASIRLACGFTRLL